jgi:hypothetical protein
LVLTCSPKPTLSRSIYFVQKLFDCFGRKHEFTPEYLVYGSIS